MADTMELKKCPFCGGEATISDGLIHCGKQMYQPLCSDCDAALGYFDNADEAAAEWNRRAGGWISVKDRLPEDEEDVIALYRFGENEKLFCGVLTYFAFDPEPHWQHESTGLRVVYWMSIPEPPKEEA